MWGNFQWEGGGGISDAKLGLRHFARILGRDEARALVGGIRVEERLRCAADAKRSRGEERRSPAPLRARYCETRNPP